MVDTHMRMKMKKSCPQRLFLTMSVSHVWNFMLRPGQVTRVIAKATRFNNSTFGAQIIPFQSIMLSEDALSLHRLWPLVDEM
jgi:hypothetical protein